jgi:arylsulfatase A-like enzyme/predicted dehydrogenase
MNTNAQLNRRQFLRSTAQAATLVAAASATAPAVFSGESPAKTIGVDCIGLGTRGGDLLNAVVPVPGVKVTAVCDVYKPHLQKGVERSQNPDVKSYLDYRELLADPRVDAVVIGTPDHWHCPMVLAAAKAGKDIYCEKGFSRTVEEAKQMRAAIKQAKIVFQLGHQARAKSCALQAKELLATGILGPVTLVRTGRFMSSDPSHPMWRWYGYYGQWNRPDPAQAVKDVDWERWLGSAPKRPWDERRFWHWRCYWDYGTGQAGDLLSHELDFVQYVLGYRCYHSGKWHVDGKVLGAGFDRSLNINNQGNYFSSAGNAIDDKPVPPALVESGYYATTATADHAIECLKDHAANHPERPFFHFVAFIAPHFPLHALPQDIAKYRDKYLAGWEAMREARFDRQKEMGLTRTTLSTIERNVGPPYAFPEAIKKLGPGEVKRPLPWGELTDEQRRFQATKMAIHAAMVDRMDQEIGRIIAQLKAMNAFENTILFFASDNGASAEMMIRDGGHDPAAPPGSAKSYLCLGPGFSSACNTPFRRHKTWVHEGGISTPLIVHWPAGITAKGELRHTPGHVIDIVPTVLELAGVQKPKEWKGEPIPEAPGQEPGSDLCPGTWAVRTRASGGCTRAIVPCGWAIGNSSRSKAGLGNFMTSKRIAPSSRISPRSCRRR